MVVSHRSQTGDLYWHFSISLTAPHLTVGTTDVVWLY